MLKLFYAPGTISIAIAITLHEAGLPFEAIKVDFASAEQTKPEYHKINPKGRVPALVTDHGTLTETSAILDYIAQLAPAADLMPSEAFAAAKTREVMSFLGTTMHINHAHRMRGSRWADDIAAHAAMAEKVPENMAGNAAYLDQDILKAPFVMGEQFTLADPYLFVICTWLKGDSVSIADYPVLYAHFQTMLARPSVGACRDAGMLPGLDQ